MFESIFVGILKKLFYWLGFPATTLDHLVRKEPALPRETLCSILDTVKNDSTALFQLMIANSKTSNAVDEDIIGTKKDYREVKVDLWIKYIIPTFPL